MYKLSHKIIIDAVGLSTPTATTSRLIFHCNIIPSLLLRRTRTHRFGFWSFCSLACFDAYSVGSLPTRSFSTVLQLHCPSLHLNFTRAPLIVFFSSLSSLASSLSSSLHFSPTSLTLERLNLVSLVSLNGLFPQYHVEHKHKR